MRRACAAVAIALAIAAESCVIAGAAGTAATCPAQRYLASLAAVETALAHTPADAAGARSQLEAALQADSRLVQVLVPIIGDLSVSPPDLGDARTRLSTLTGTLALPPGATCHVDDSALGTLHDVYRSPVFANIDQNQQSGFFQQVGQFLLNLLQKIGSLFGHAAGALGNALGLGGSLALTSALLVLVLAAAWWRLRGNLAGRAAVAAAEPGDVARDPDAEWSLALAAAARQDYREAIRRAFRSALLDVAWRGRLRIDATWTTRELLQSAAGDADLVTLLAPAAAVFDRAWYSGRAVSGADWEVLRARCEAIRDLARRAQPRAPA